VSRNPPAAVLWGKLAWHPAVVAWRDVVPDATEPESIEVLRRGKKSTVYRLVGAGPDGTPVIAQRASRRKADIERTVYEAILPHLSVTAPRYYGAREESPEHAWLFVEDIGDDRYSASEPEELALAGRWVGLMHAGATSVGAARRLPDAGPPRYLTHLRAGRRTLAAHVANPALKSDEATTIGGLVADLDRLERGWARLERACTRVPATLTHGDLQRKNTYIRDGPHGPALFVIDWETAGWGAPAADLTRIDLPTYWSVVRSAWRDVRLEDVRQVAAVGRVFLQLAAIDWVSPELAYDSPLYLSRPMSWLRVLHHRLVEAIGAMGGIP